MSEMTAEAVAGSPARALRSGRPALPDALPVLVASPTRAARQRQMQPQQENDPVAAMAVAMAAGAAGGGVHARRPSTSSSASSSSSSSSVSSYGGAPGEGAAAAAHPFGSPTRHRQQQQQAGAGPGLGSALPTLQVRAPPASPGKVTRASAAAAGVVPSSPHGLNLNNLNHPAQQAQHQQAPPASPRPTERPPPGEALEEQSSPLRRSQTQHLREAAEAEEAGAAGGGKSASQASLEPRLGERYQIPEEALPRNMAEDVGAACYDPWNIAACAQKGLVWHPGDVDEELAGQFAEEVAASMRDERCGDEGAELGWLVLRATGSVERAVAAAEDETLRGQWSREEEAAFVQGIKDHDKNFRRIKVRGCVDGWGA